MSWSTPKDLLERFKSIKPPKEFTTDAVVTVLSEFNININKDDIRLNRGVLYIRGLHPTERSDVTIQKMVIIQKLKSKLDIVDIRF